MDSGLAQWEGKESSTPDEGWAALQQVVYNTAKTYLGKPDRKHQDWFDPRECCKPGALDPPLQHTQMPADCYKTHSFTEFRLVGKEGSGVAESCRQK